MIERLIHGRTHVCWTPDHDPNPEKVSLIRESDLVTLEQRAARMEHALRAISGYSYMGSARWHETYPKEAARMTAKDDPISAVCDIAQEAFT